MRNFVADIGTEELEHPEMAATIVHQLTKDLSMEDIAAEQKARTTYDNILRLVYDQEVCEPIKFLRAREIVHFQGFGEANREDCSKFKLQENVGVLPT